MDYLNINGLFYTTTKSLVVCAQSKWVRSHCCSEFCAYFSSQINSVQQFVTGFSTKVDGPMWHVFVFSHLGNLSLSGHFRV